MSDAGRKMDVEDVLSSIRRLVSEEARSVPEADVAPKSRSDIQEPSTPEGEKLVLTPSLRVGEEDGDQIETSALEQRINEIEDRVRDTPPDATFQIPQLDADPPQDEGTDLDEDSDATQDFAPTSFEDAVADSTPDFSDAAPSTEAAMSALNLSIQDFARREPPLTAGISPSLPAEDDADSHFPTDSPFEANLSEKDIPTPSSLTTANSNDATILSEDMTADEADQDAPSDEAKFVDVAEPLTFEFPKSETPPEESAAEPEETEELEAFDPSEVSAQRTEINRPEAYFEDVEDTSQDEVQDEVQDEIQDPMQAAEDIVADALQDTDGDGAEDRKPAGFADADYDPEIDFTEEGGAFLDEETLREMVSEMVRSELQGELGDRITRNVRKLVRREIYRALASRDFE